MHHNIHIITLPVLHIQHETTLLHGSCTALMRSAGATVYLLPFAPTEFLSLLLHWKFGRHCCILQTHLVWAR